MAPACCLPGRGLSAAVPIACVSETPTGSLSLSILHFIPLRLFTGSSDSTLAVTPDLRPESVFSLSPVLHLLTSYPFQVFCVDTHLPCTYAHLSLTGATVREGSPGGLPLSHEYPSPQEGRAA